MGKTQSSTEKYVIAGSVVGLSSLIGYFLMLKAKKSSEPNNLLLGEGGKNRKSTTISNFKKQLEAEKNRDYEASINRLRQLKQEIEKGVKTSLESMEVLGNFRDFLGVFWDRRDIFYDFYLIYIFFEILPKMFFSVENNF